MLLDLGRRPQSDGFSEIDHQDAVGDVHDHGHIVFNEQNGHTELILNILDPENQILLFFRVHARAGFVQQKQFRLQGQGPPQFDEFLGAIGQSAYQFVAHRLQFQKIDDFLYFFPMPDLFPAGKGPSAPHQAAPEQAGLHVQVAAQQDIVQAVHVGKEFDVLKGSGNPQPGDRLGLQALDLLLPELDMPRIRGINPVDAVEQGGLASSVGTDDRKDFPGLHLKGDAFQGLQAPEGDAQIANLKKTHGGQTSAMPEAGLV